MSYLQIPKSMAKMILRIQGQRNTFYHETIVRSSESPIREIIYNASREKVDDQDIFEALLSICEYLSRTTASSDAEEPVQQWLFEHTRDIQADKWIQKVTIAESPIKAIKQVIRFEKNIRSFFKKAKKAMPAYTAQLEVVTVFLDNRISRLKVMKKTELINNWNISGSWWALLESPRIKSTHSVYNR